VRAGQLGVVGPDGARRGIVGGRLLDGHRPALPDMSRHHQSALADRHCTRPLETPQARRALSSTSRESIALTSELPAFSNNLVGAPSQYDVACFQVSQPH
jgi:hypothetical protein